MRSRSAAAGLMKASRPAPSTVISPVAMLASTSSVSSRSRRSSVSTSPSTAPVCRSRSPRYPVASATAAKSTICRMALASTVCVL